MIRFLEKKDIPEVLKIYQLGIDTGIATFETIVPTLEDWHTKYHKTLRFVYSENDDIIGWIGITPISSRDAYKGVGEVSVYVHPNATGNGVGHVLLNHLIEEAKTVGYWMLQSSIFEKNYASIRLHEKAGFRLVGIRKGISKKNDVWVNTVIMERHLILDLS